jgi:hypothetical protein
MRDGVEILGYVGIDDIHLALKEMRLHVVHRLMGTPLWSEPVRVVLKVSFEYGFDYYLHGHLHYSVSDRRDS